jgi:hypothetical protein
MMGVPKDSDGVIEGISDSYHVGTNIMQMKRPVFRKNGAKGAGFAGPPDNSGRSTINNAFKLFSMAVS